jgi:hypothetical protein
MGEVGMSARPDLKPWERQPEESPKAHAAFIVYRDLGAARTFLAAARVLGKNSSLLRRWADRHQWRERVYTWDVAQAREDEAAVRRQRDDLVRRQVQDVDRLQRLAMAKLSSLVRKDPQTGELTLDPKVTPLDAVRIYQLTLDIERKLADSGDGAERADAVSAPEADLRGLSSPELVALMALARERARPSTPEGGNSR